MALSQERIQEIERATVGQKLNPLWTQYRKNRLTGSIFGRALKSLGQYVASGSKNKFNELRLGIVGTNEITCEAIRWVNEHEADGIKE